MHSYRLLSILIGAAFLAAAVPAAAQEREEQAPVLAMAEIKAKAPKVFIDFEHGDMDYIRTEIPFVNYVRDRKEADVHVLITTQDTGSGGTEYTLAFIGQGACQGVDNQLVYSAGKTETEEEIRRGYTAVLKMGLVPYTARTPIRGSLDVGGKLCVWGQKDIRPVVPPHH